MDEESYYRFYQERRYSYITSPTPDESKFPLFYKAEKKEYVLEPGQCLFIPKYWFHLVVAEDVDEKTGLNFSACFFYPGCEGLETHIVNHDLKLDPMTIFQKDKVLEVSRTKTECFLSNFVRYKFPFDNIYMYMTFDEFYEAKNRHLCIVDHYFDFTNAPLHNSDPSTSQIRINFGENTCSMLHCDGMDSAICQIQGKKRVLVFPPTEASRLYVMNPYPLEMVEIIHRNCVQDKYVRIYKNVIDPNTCHDIYGMKPERTRRLHSIQLQNWYIKECRKFGQDMEQNEENIWHDQQKDIPTSFIVLDPETVSQEIVIDQMDSSITVLFVLTKGIIKINKVEHTVAAGDSICFPSSITHPWFAYKNTVIIYPNFNKE